MKPSCAVWFLKSFIVSLPTFLLRIIPTWKATPTSCSYLGKFSGISLLITIYKKRSFNFFGWTLCKAHIRTGRITYLLIEQSSHACMRPRYCSSFIAFHNCKKYSQFFGAILKTRNNITPCRFNPHSCFKLHCRWHSKLLQKYLLIYAAQKVFSLK